MQGHVPLMAEPEALISSCLLRGLGIAGAELASDRGQDDISIIGAYVLCQKSHPHNVLM